MGNEHSHPSVNRADEERRMWLGAKTGEENVAKAREEFEYQRHVEETERLQRLQEREREKEGGNETANQPGEKDEKGWKKMPPLYEEMEVEEPYHPLRRQTGRDSSQDHDQEGRDLAHDQLDGQMSYEDQKAHVELEREERRRFVEDDAHRHALLEGFQAQEERVASFSKQHRNKQQRERKERAKRERAGERRRFIENRNRHSVPLRGSPLKRERAPSPPSSVPNELEAQLSAYKPDDVDLKIWWNTLPEDSQQALLVTSRADLEEAQRKVETSLKQYLKSSEAGSDESDTEQNWIWTKELEHDQQQGEAGTRPDAQEILDQWMLNEAEGVNLEDMGLDVVNANSEHLNILANCALDAQSGKGSSPPQDWHSAERQYLQGITSENLMRKAMLKSEMESLKLQVEEAEYTLQIHEEFDVRAAVEESKEDAFETSEEEGDEPFAAEGEESAPDAAQSVETEMRPSSHEPDLGTSSKPDPPLEWPFTESRTSRNGNRNDPGKKHTKSSGSQAIGQANLKLEDLQISNNPDQKGQVGSQSNTGYDAATQPNPISETYIHTATYKEGKIRIRRRPKYDPAQDAWMPSPKPNPESKETKATTPPVKLSAGRPRKRSTRVLSSELDENDIGKQRGSPRRRRYSDDFPPLPGHKRTPVANEGRAMDAAPRRRISPYVVSPVLRRLAERRLVIHRVRASINGVYSADDARQGEEYRRSISLSGAHDPHDIYAQALGLGTRLTVDAAMPKLDQTLSEKGSDSRTIRKEVPKHSDVLHGKAMSNRVQESADKRIFLEILKRKSQWPGQASALYRRVHATEKSLERALKGRDMLHPETRKDGVLVRSSEAVIRGLCEELVPLRRRLLNHVVYGQPILSEEQWEDIERKDGNIRYANEKRVRGWYTLRRPSIHDPPVTQRARNAERLEASRRAKPAHVKRPKSLDPGIYSKHPAASNGTAFKERASSRPKDQTTKTKTGQSDQETHVPSSASKVSSETWLSSDTARASSSASAIPHDGGCDVETPVDMVSAAFSRALSDLGRLGTADNPDMERYDSDSRRPRSLDVEDDMELFPSLERAAADQPSPEDYDNDGDEEDEGPESMQTIVERVSTRRLELDSITGIAQDQTNDNDASSGHEVTRGSPPATSVSAHDTIVRAPSGAIVAGDAARDVEARRRRTRERHDSRSQTITRDHPLGDQMPSDLEQRMLIWETGTDPRDDVRFDTVEGLDGRLRMERREAIEGGKLIWANQWLKPPAAHVLAVSIEGIF